MMLLAQMGPDWTFGTHLALAAADGKKDAATVGASHRYTDEKAQLFQAAGRLPPSQLAGRRSAETRSRSTRSPTGDGGKRRLSSSFGWSRHAGRAAMSWS